MNITEQIEQMREERADKQLYVCALIAYGGICMSKPMTHEEAMQTQRFYTGVEGFTVVMPAGKTDEQYKQLFSPDYKYVPAKED